METTWREENLKKITLNLVSNENLFYEKSLHQSTQSRMGALCFWEELGRISERAENQQEQCS